MGTLAEHRAKKAARLAQDGDQTVVNPLQNMLCPSRNQYTQLRDRWARFLETQECGVVTPHQAILEEFWWWYAQNSVGRLSPKVTLNTLLYNIGRFASMYKHFYKVKIPEEVNQNLRLFVSEDLVEGLGIQDIQYEKPIADWNDVEEIIEFILKYDNHNYRCSRIPAQIVFAFLVISEHGERGGAITRSECYREDKTSDVTLCYRDIKLFLRDETKRMANGLPDFRLEITFRNRKGARSLNGGHDSKKASKIVVQDYYLRPDCDTCIVLWFLGLALLDDAFAEVKSAKEIFAMQPCEKNETLVVFKSAVLRTPLLRRPKPQASEVSHLPYTYGSLLNQGKRIVRSAGFPQRFTFYNIRRGVANALGCSPDITEVKRKQTMGHQGPSNKTFERFYLSTRIVADTGNIFRGQAPRDDRTEVLSMHIHRDYSRLQKPIYSDKRTDLVSELYSSNTNQVDCLTVMLTYFGDTAQRSSPDQGNTSLQPLPIGRIPPPFETPGNNLGTTNNSPEVDTVLRGSPSQCNISAPPLSVRKRLPPLTMLSNNLGAAHDSREVVDLGSQGTHIDWTSEEVEKLLILRKRGTRWNQVAAELHHSVSDTRNKYTEITGCHLPWTDSENGLLLSLRSKPGMTYNEMSKRLPGRTSESVRMQCSRLIRRANTAGSHVPREKRMNALDNELSPKRRKI